MPIEIGPAEVEASVAFGSPRTPPGKIPPVTTENTLLLPPAN